MYKHATLTVVAAVLITVLTTVATTDLTNGNATVFIERGGTADLSPALTRQGSGFPGEESTDGCVIRVTGSDSQRCGTIRPNLIPCWEVYRSSVTYSHFGCFDDMELIHLQVLRDDGVANVQVAVQVVDSTHHLAAIGNSLKLEALPVAEENDRFILQLKFPARWQGACSYALALYPGVLPLPHFGLLGGPVNQQYTCGYYPREPITYTPTRRTNFTDHVIVQLYAESVAESVRVLLPIHTPPEAQPEVAVLPPISFPVYHTGLSALNPQIFLANMPFLLLDFKVKVEGHGGSFVTHGTPLDQIQCSNVSVFTHSDLLQGGVAFLPCLLPHNTSVAHFQYSVMDFSGTLLATTTITANLADRLTPVTPLLLTSPSEAMQQLQVPILGAIEKAVNLSCSHQLLWDPQGGYLEWTGPEYSLNSSIDHSFGLTQEELLLGNLSYRRIPHPSSVLHDHFHWETRCPGTHPLQMTILISSTEPDQWPPIVDFNLFQLLSFVGYASQLNGVMLQSNDPDSNTWGTIYQVFTENGRFMLSPAASELGQLHLPEFLLQTLSGASTVTNFTQEQLDHGDVWYLPDQVEGNSSLILLLQDTSHNAQPEPVLVHVQVTLDTPATSDRQVEAVYGSLKLLSLELTHFHPSASITSDHLSVVGLQAHYVILSSPFHGHLCFGDVPCTESVTSFTQSAIDNGLLHYHPSEESFSVDAFQFLITGDVTILEWFVIYRGLSPLEAAVQSIQQASSSLVLEAGSSAPLTAGLLGAWADKVVGAVELAVVRTPEYGKLSVEGTFSLADLGNVSYTHSGQDSCSDQMLLAVFVDGVATELIVITVTVTVTYPQFIPLVIPNPVTISQPSIALGGDNILVLGSPACPNVTFLHVTEAPQNGTLLLDVKDDSQDVLVLEQGSRFSLGDLLLGVVGYSLRPQLNQDEAVSDSLSFVVPLVSGTQEHLLSIQYTRTTSPYQVSVNPPNSLYVSHIGGGKYGVTLTRSTLQASVLPVPAPKVAGVILSPPTLLPGHRRVGDNGPLTPLPPIVPLEDLNRAELVFELQQTPLNITDDVLGVSVTVNTSLLQTPLTSAMANISLKWAYVFFELPFLSVKEEEEEGGREVVLTVRRIGHVDINSTVEVVVVKGNATIGCTHGGDVCATNTTLELPAGVEVAEYQFTLYSDLLVEGVESFALQLIGGVGVVPHLEGGVAEVIIVDSAVPPTLLGFDVTGAHPSPNPSKCDLEVNVSEDIGILSLTIFQQGVITGSVGTICYTEYDPDDIKPNVGFVPRPKDPSSLVLFDQNSPVASCDVQILDNMVYGRDKSLVVSLGVTIGDTRLDTQSDKICVHVTNDDNDTSAKVGFESSTVTTVRRITSTVALFTVTRTGSAHALNKPTTIRFNVSSNGSAVEGVDFILPERSVTFGPGSTSVEGVIIILEHSGLGFEPKSFQISIAAVENGTLGADGRLLNVVIVSSEIAIVEFKYAEGVLAENVTDTPIPIIRHGNQNVTSQIRCEISLISQNGTHLQPVSRDITMGPGQSEAFCHVHIIDDHIWEGNSEVVLLHIQPLDEHTIGGLQTTFKGSIIDREDIPTVQFASPYIMEVEPLSHYSVDARNATLTLLRSGDPTQLLTVEFWTGNGDNDIAGVAGIDYKNTSGTVKFPPGIMSAELHVVLLSNHQRHHDFSFFVYIRKPVQATLPLIGTVSAARVDVINSNLGPFFPDRPRVVSSEHPQSLDDMLCASSPLLCVTPCDEEWGDNEVYKKECRDQAIVHQRTKYTWEMSVIYDDNNNVGEFLPLKFENILAPPDERYLLPVHMLPNRYVRCKATAVSANDIEGYTRVSQPIRLVKCPPADCGPAEAFVTATLTPTGDETTGLEDMVSLTVSRVPHQDNEIPLLSTTPFPDDVTPLLTHRPSRQHHQCSNLAVGEFHSLTGAFGSWQDLVDPLALYNKHLDKISCQWTFTSYHRLQDLIDVCGGTLSKDDGTGNTFTLNVPIYLTYVFFDTTSAIPGRALSANTTASLRLSLPPTSPHLPSPLREVHNSSHNASLEVVSVGVRNSLLEVLVQTSLNAEDRVFSLSNSFASADSGISLALELLQTSSSQQPVAQLWKMAATGVLSDYSGTYEIQLVKCVIQYHSYCVPLEKTSFQFQIERQTSGSEYMVGVVPQVTLKPTFSDAATDEDEVIEVGVGVFQGQLLHPGLRVAVTRAIVCQNRNPHSRRCEARAVEVAPAGAGRRARGVALGNREVLPNNSFAFSTSDLAAGTWYLDTRYVIVNGSEVLFPVLEDADYSVSKEFTVAEVSVVTPTIPIGVPLPSQENISVSASVSFGLSVAITVAIVIVIVIITIVLCLLRRVRRPPQHRIAARRRHQNVRVQCHGVATMTKLNNGTERIVCRIEMIQAASDTTSLPEGVHPRTTGSNLTHTLGDNSPATTSHRSLPADLPSRRNVDQVEPEELDKDAPYEHVIHIDNGHELADNVEAFVAAMVRTPPDSRNNLQSNV